MKLSVPYIVRGRCFIICFLSTFMYPFCFCQTYSIAVYPFSRLEPKRAEKSRSTILNFFPFGQPEAERAEKSVLSNKNLYPFSQSHLERAENLFNSSC